MSEKLTDHQLRVLLIGKWLVRFGAIYPLYGRTIPEERFKEFLEAFKDTSPEDLDFAFTKTRDEHTGDFPTPADVLKRLRTQDTDAERFHAEKAWDELRWMLRTFGSEDGWMSYCCSSENPKWLCRYAHLLEAKPYNGGFLIQPKPFSAQMSLAIERVGGLDRIRMLENKEHDWVRKDFFEVFTRHAQTCGYTQIPGKQEAKQIMDRLKELADEI